MLPRPRHRRQSHCRERRRSLRLDKVVVTAATYRHRVPTWDVVHGRWKAGRDRNQPLQMGHQLLRGRDRVAAARGSARRRRLRFSEPRYRRSGHAGHRSHRHHRLVEHGPVRRAVPVRAGAGRKAALCGALDAAGPRAADAWPDCSARRLSHAGRPPQRAALAASGRRQFPDRRFRIGRRQSRHDALVGSPLAGAGTVRRRRPCLHLSHGKLRRPVLTGAVRNRHRRAMAGPAGLGRSDPCARGARRMADIHGHGRQLSPARDVHARTRRRCAARPARLDRRHRRAGGRTGRRHARTVAHDGSQPDASARGRSRAAVARRLRP